MTKNILTNYSLLFYFVEAIPILLFLCFCGCQKTTTVEESEVEKIIKTLPHNNPDSCIKIIRKVKGLTPQEESNLCQNIIYTAFDEQSSETYLKHLDNFEAFRGDKDPKLRGMIFLHRGLKFKEMARYDTALVCMKNAKNIFIQLNDSTYVAQTLRRMSEVYTAQTRYVAATSQCLEMISYLGKKKDLEWEYAMTGMVMCYVNQQKYQKAKELDWETLHLAEARKDTTFILYKYYSLSREYSFLNQPDSALWAIQKSDSLARKIHYTEMTDVTFAKLGIIWRRNGNFEKGLLYSQKAFHLFDSLGKKDSKIGAINEIGHCYAMTKQWDKAEEIYLENLDEVKQLEKKNLEIEVYDSLVSLNLQREGNLKVWNYLKRSRLLRDSLYNAEKAYIMEDLNVQYETAEREKRIKELATEKKLLRLLTIIMVLLLFIAICTIILVAYRNRQRRLILLKENQLLAAKEQLHTQELATKEQFHALELAAKEKLYAVELNSHKQQLENFKQNIFLKNQIIGDLENRVQNLLPSNEEMQKEYEHNKQLLSEIRILTERDWKTYISYFQKVYEGFMERVMAKFPDLTPAELRLFLLLKQELDSKEISNILGVSPNTVKKSRQRLRKKLELLESEELDAFVLNF